MRAPRPCVLLCGPSGSGRTALVRRLGLPSLALDDVYRDAEGIFAAQLVTACRDADLLADAVCLHLSPWMTFWRRLLRDLAEVREPPWVLLRRGDDLRRAEPALVARWTAPGCRPLAPRDAERAIRALLPAA